MKRREILMGSGAVAIGASGAARQGKAAGTQAPPMERDVLDPTFIDARLDSRSITFENPTGSRGAGGMAAGGRKGRPSYILRPGEKVVLANINSSGTIRHVWITIDDWQPEVMRALRFEVFYDGLSEPSISTPVLDFFGLPHGRRAEYYSAMVSTNEGRGFNSYMPMPFQQSVRVEFTNESARHVTLFHQIDYTLEPAPRLSSSYLHASFRRENPTTQKRDFVIAEGLKGPGRFFGCSVGIRVLDKGPWYGEGEVKIYKDGDLKYPTICGTGLEDYVGSAWGLGRHYSQYSGAPIVAPDGGEITFGAKTPNLVSFYRWHLPDPIMFAKDLRVTIQQIGIAFSLKSQEAEIAAFKREHLPAGDGWLETAEAIGGLVERRDDYCATAFVYCQEPQPVPRFDTSVAARDVGLFAFEKNDKRMSDDDRDRRNKQMKERK